MAVNYPLSLPTAMHRPQITTIILHPYRVVSMAYHRRNVIITIALSWHFFVADGPVKMYL